jgi:molybdenum cofactor guanylyltransferase
MLGVILCGGQSRRMGVDKALLKTPENTTWAQEAMNKLALLQFPVLLSINQLQLPAFENIFSTKQLIPDNTTLLLIGPLLGVLSAYLSYPGEDFFFLACDMPFMQFPILKELYRQYKTNDAADVHVFINNSAPEPLCGIYTARALKHIHQLYQTQQLPGYSMKFVLEQVTTALYPINNKQQNCFRNINTPNELNGL